MKITTAFLLGLFCFSTAPVFGVNETVETSQYASNVSPPFRVALNLATLLAGRRAITAGRARFTDPRTGSDDLYGGLSAEFAFRAIDSVPNLLFGLELSWMEGAGIIAGSNATRLGFLPTVLYRFPSEFRSFTPYVGLAIGGSYYTGSGGTVGGYNELSFQGLAKLGFDLGTTVAVHLEPNLGLLGDRFVFIPKLGISAAF